MTQAMQPDDPGAETTVEASTVGERVLHDLVSYGVGITRDGEHISIDDVFTYPEIPLPSVHPVDLVVGEAPSKKPSAVPCAPSTSSWGQLDQHKVPGNWPKVFAPPPVDRDTVAAADSLRQTIERIEGAGRKQAAQDSSVWDLPDPATRGAAKMQAEIVRALWSMHKRPMFRHAQPTIEIAIKRILRLDPAKVVE